MIRLDKLVGTVAGSRTEAKKIIAKGRVKINGNVVKSSDYKVDENVDEVFFCGKMINYKKFTYIMLNKPEGVVSATKDNVYDTVMECLPKSLRKKDLFPVGRLDVDTTGLLILTNNGKFAHNTLSPKKHVNKKYRAEIIGELKKEHIEKFKNGIEFKDGTKCDSSKLVILSSGEKSSCIVEIHEGKFHQVKKMFLAIGCEVEFLTRISFGPIDLDEDLEIGKARELTKSEMDLLEKYL